MTRQEYIERVKVKLDEISPFDEPLTFIAADGDNSFDKVKPITIYIDKELDNATRYCLSILSLRLLSSDINEDEKNISIENAVGHIGMPSNYRLCRVKAEGLEREVTHFLSTEDASYLLQQNKHTRSGCAKPSAFYNAETGILELYSLPADSEIKTVTVWYIDTEMKAEDVASSIEDFIVLKCAQLVLDILGNQSSALMEKEFERKVSVL